MTNMLDILMRLKNVKNLDPRQSTLVENAYYLCKPPERSARISKVRPPLHQYIRKLLFSDLDKDSIANVLKQLRKLPWRRKMVGLQLTERKYTKASHTPLNKAKAEILQLQRHP
ncbi:unnamed protein product [Arabidopsis lyrata]|nr:unnamed protein product [Arabidopsis lyrata]